MRVIAGEARGVTLGTPASGARPTMDKVRAAIFSSLGDAVPGARVLDLFAGSGGMGIEALSRGAVEAVFVDSDAKATACVKANLAKTGLKGSVQTMDAMKFMSLYAQDRFDLIFADPPYAKREEDRDFAGELICMPEMAAALGSEGTLILERAAGRPVPEGCLLQLLRTRRYGESEVAYYSAG